MQIALETEDNRTEQLSRLVILYEKEMLKLCYVYLRDMTLAQLNYIDNSSNTRISPLFMPLSERMASENGTYTT